MADTDTSTTAPEQAPDTQGTDDLDVIVSSLRVKREELEARLAADKEALAASAKNTGERIAKLKADGAKERKRLTASIATTRDELDMVDRFLASQVKRTRKPRTSSS
jgi:hypothetical protein